MKISILTFGATRDIIGENNLSLDLENGLQVGKLKQNLESEYPELIKLNSLFIAVNEEYAESDQVLNDGDIVALIPPVSGG